MTAGPVALADLLSTRERMSLELQNSLSAHERNFLLSLAHAEPDCSLLEIEHLEQLPAVRWKLQNLRQLAKGNPEKLRVQADELSRLLQLP
jgi:hypothetical protein